MTSFVFRKLLTGTACFHRKGSMKKENKAKGKRQRAKIKNYFLFLPLPFYFCLLPFALFFD
jgi:hypothetical protein